MANRDIVLEGTTIVILGAYNPAIFSPLWFKEQGLVGTAEIEDQEVKIISRDIAVFRLGWLECHINRDALQLSTSNPEEPIRLRDAAAAILRLLGHTPVSALGINRNFHTAVNNIDQLHAIGDALAPKNVWDGALLSAGMRSVTLWGQREDEQGGHVQVQVEPSNRYPQAVYIGYNDHFTLTPGNPDPNPRDFSWDLNQDSVELSSEKNAIAIRILQEEWNASMARAEKLWRTVLDLGTPA